MLPAKKKRITDSGSVLPSAPLTVKICVMVFRQGSSMKPKNRYTKKAMPKTFQMYSGFSHEAFFVMVPPPYASAGAS